MLFIFLLYGIPMPFALPGSNVYYTFALISICVSGIMGISYAAYCIKIAIWNNQFEVNFIIVCVRGNMVISYLVYAIEMYVWKQEQQHAGLL